MYLYVSLTLKLTDSGDLGQPGIVPVPVGTG